MLSGVNIFTFDGCKFILESQLHRCDALEVLSCEWWFRKSLFSLQKSIQGRLDTERLMISLFPLWTKGFMRSYACMLQTIDTTKDPFFNRKMHSGV